MSVTPRPRPSSISDADEVRFIVSNGAGDVIPMRRPNARQTRAAGLGSGQTRELHNIANRYTSDAAIFPNSASDERPTHIQLGSVSQKPRNFSPKRAVRIRAAIGGRLARQVDVARD
jgi:hypothetical protein